ncbi:MAG TPA: riboflavin synthase [Jiangellaceae bacterium]
MFTGIIEELGEVVALELDGDSARLAFNAPLVSGDAVHGASIAVNGVCLTVVEVVGETVTADVMRETLERSTLGGLHPGEKVNLERAVRASDRLGGHIVQGHVDGVEEVHSRTPGERWEVVRIGLTDRLARYVAGKGSIAVDGVSLTVSGLGDDWFEVSLIPTTLDSTTLGLRKPGEWVNLEVDVIAKYVERVVRGSAG